MAELRIAENIVLYRKNRGITQEELAEFLGVTKASVSKWETGQSCPDILLLPQIASFFDLSIDELMGYSPQLSPEQIVKIYQDLAKAFATEEYEQVIEKSRKYVKNYYSCYPLLYRMAVLWLNHYMMAKDPKRQEEILHMALELCNRIHENSKDVTLQVDALMLKSVVNLQLGNNTEVIETMQPMFESNQLRLQGDSILIQAYQMSGNIDQADSCNQLMMYCHLFGLLTSNMLHIILHMDKPDVCKTTIARMQMLIDTYEIKNLSMNSVLQFYYQAALVYATQKEKEPTLQYLDLFVSGALKFLSSDITIHGDAFFDRLEEWLQKLTLDAAAPRNPKVVLSSLPQVLMNPVFEFLKEDSEFCKIQKQLNDSARKEN